MCSPGGALQLQQLHGAFAANTPGGTSFRGGFDSATRQAFMLPLSVTPSLRTLHTVRLEDDGSTLRDGGSRAFVEALPLSGTLTVGNLTATAFDEQTNVLTGLYFSKAPNRYEVAQLTVSDGGARFTTLGSVDSPDANGFLLQKLEGTSSQLGAVGGNDVRPLTITGSQAQWGLPVSGQPYSDATVYDRDANRVLSLGSYQFVPPMGARWLPTIQERSPTAATFSPIAMTGTGLPSVEPGMPTPYPFMAWDAVGGRLLVTGSRPEQFGMMTIMVPTVVEADLRTRQWRVLPNTNVSSIVMRTPFITDRQFRQVFGPDFNAVSLAPGREFSQAPLKLTGALPPNFFSSLSSATRLADGRVLVSSNGALFTFDASTTRWATLPARLPMTQAGGVSLAFDPVGQRALILFGQGGGTPSSDILALSADGSSMTPVPTTGTPPPGRMYAGVVVAGTTLVIAGGIAGTQTLGDVYALDLTSLVWRKVIDATPRQQPSLVALDGAVFIVGGRSTVPFVPTIERVDLALNQLRTVAATGTAPTGYASFAPLGNGLVGFDIGMSFDFGSDQLFELKLENNTAVWTNSDPRAMDQALSPLIGVAGANCNEALFVGSSSFKVSR